MSCVAEFKPGGVNRPESGFHCSLKGYLTFILVGLITRLIVTCQHITLCNIPYKQGFN
jgi:hypothetical protein